MINKVICWQIARMKRLFSQETVLVGKDCFLKCQLFLKLLRVSFQPLSTYLAKSSFFLFYIMWQRIRSVCNDTLFVYTLWNLLFRFIKNDFFKCVFASPPQLTWNCSSDWNVGNKINLFVVCMQNQLSSLGCKVQNLMAVLILFTNFEEDL